VLFRSDKLKDIPKKRLLQYSPAFRYGIVSGITKKTGVDYIPWKTNSGEYKLTRSQRVQLYIASKNKDAMYHILGGERSGIYFGKDTPKKYKPSFNDFQKLMEGNTYSITPEEKKVADAILEYTKEQGRRINEVSNKDIGYNIAEEENYFHLNVKSSEVKDNIQPEDVKSIEDIQKYFKMSSPSSLKTRIQSDAPLVINGAFEEIGRQSGLIEKYIGLYLPSKQVESILKSISRTMEQKGLVPELNTLKKINHELQMPSNSQSLGGRIAYQLDQLFVPATLGLNIPVAVMQPIDLALYYTQGMPGIKPANPINIASSILKTTANIKKIAEKARSLDPLLRERHEGQIQRELFGKNYESNARDIAGLNHKGIRKVFSAEGVMNMISAMDEYNTALIWSTVEEEMKINRPELKYDSPEFNKAVAERTVDIIENTQPNYDALDKPLSMSVPFLRPLTYFSLQGVKIGQISLRAIDKMRKGQLFEGVGDLLTIAITAASVEALRLSWRTLRGKDKPDEWTNKWSWINKIISNQIGNLGLVGNLLSNSFNDFTGGSYGGPIFELNDQMISLFRTLRKDIQDGTFDKDKILKNIDKITDITVPGKRSLKQWNEIASNLLNKIGH
jgi:hypothetical protein